MIGYMNKELELQGMLEDAKEIGEAKGIDQGYRIRHRERHSKRKNRNDA